jgi:adenylate cyclase
VIARTSSFSYKGKAEKIQTIGRELGVKYLLEGSTRKAGDHVRINAQLVDAATGNEFWSQRYDRQMRDIFKLQDEVVQSLTKTLGLQLFVLEKGFVISQRTYNLEAYDYFLQGFEEFTQDNSVAFMRSRKMLEEAISLDPRYADAYAVLSRLLLLDARSGLQRDVRRRIDRHRVDGCRDQVNVSAVLLRKLKIVREKPLLAGSLP